jgi:hypothetical protein
LGNQCNFRYKFYQQRGAAAPAGTQAAVWNAAVMKRLFKNQAGEIKLSSFDILSKNNNFFQITGDNYIETTEREVLKRVFALSFRYNFRINRL